MTIGKVTIRAVEPVDAAALQALFNHYEAYSQTLHLPYTDQFSWQQRVQPEAAGTHTLVAVIEGEIVGMIALTLEGNIRRRHVANIGLGVHPQYAGKGVGSRLLAAAIELADRWVNVQRLELTVFVDNVAAIKLYEKFGFVVEGRARGFAYRDGTYEDVYQMARCRWPSID
ncbi:MAG: GNAT family N-acetyltransferase [Neisseriaceae bacterium]|nr:GNAT family N-acetyltransferase [Neisseriaceae bacterium]MBP6862828.1 GNAT family N-acetyltransferase [Neisseriaceae bacterium]